MTNVWNTIVTGSALVFGTYVIGQALVFRQIEAVDYWEARGYLNGLVKGSGDYETAVSNLKYWRDYWMERAWWKGLVNNLYNYGMRRATELYGSAGSAGSVGSAGYEKKQRIIYG